jgi:hypothetical protein
MRAPRLYNKQQSVLHVSKAAVAATTSTLHAQHTPSALHTEAPADLEHEPSGCLVARTLAPA